MRTLLIPLFLLLLPAGLAACGGDDASPPEPEALREPDVPTPPPVLETGEDVLALMPQEPLPDGVERTVVEPSEATTEPGQEASATAAAEVVETSPPPAATPAPTGTLEIVEAAIAREVVDRLPVGEGPYAEGTEVHCFTRIRNPGGERRQIKHNWYHEGARKSSIPLSVKAETWRTWSNVPVHGKGAWRVDVVDEAGAVLKSLTFTVE